MSIILRFYVFSSLFCSQFTDPHTKTSMKKDQKPANVALGYRLIRLETFFIFSFIRQLFGIWLTALDLEMDHFFYQNFVSLSRQKESRKWLILCLYFVCRTVCWITSALLPLCCVDERHVSRRQVVTLHKSCFLSWFFVFVWHVM